MRSELSNRKVLPLSAHHACLALEYSITPRQLDDLQDAYSGQGQTRVRSLQTGLMFPARSKPKKSRSETDLE